MKNVRIKEMKLRNFKGITDLTINFNCLDTSVSARNGSGKTTIFDAFTWLFFNKDSMGNVPNTDSFSVRPKDENGNIIHHLEYSVETVLTINDEEKSFKKILVEKFEKSRGVSSDKCTGTTNKLYIDDIEVKLKEFNETVNNLFNEDIFKLITNPFYFNSLKWEEQMKILIEMYGDISDEEVIAQNKELNPLSEAAKTKGIDKYLLQLKQQIKKIKDEQNIIPVQIKEAQLAIPTDIETIDEDKLTYINNRINELEAKKQTVLNGVAIAEKETELIKLRNQRLLIKNEVPDVKPLKDEEYSLSVKIDSLEHKKERAENEIRAKKSQQKSNELMRDELRNKFTEVNNMQYDESKNICPHCGQELPQEKIDGFMEEFNISKSNQLKNIASDGKALKAKFESLVEDVEVLENDIKNNEILINDYKLKLKEVTEKIANINEDFAKEQEPKINAVDEQIVNAEREVEFLKSNTGEEVAKINEEIGMLKEQRSHYEEIKAKINLVEVQKKRIKELKEREVFISKEKTEREKMQYLCELFIQEKTNMISENINKHFEITNFVFYKEKYNGEIEKTCLAVSEGKNEKETNNAKKYNIGLDIINAISKYYDIYMPIFIDNCEGVNEFIKTQSQQIKFYVSEDETLRIENK